MTDSGAVEKLKRLQMLRNIGPKMAADPDALYEELKRRNGGKLDRCVLYAFRGAKHGIPWPQCKDPFAPPGQAPL